MTNITQLLEIDENRYKRLSKGLCSIIEQPPLKTLAEMELEECRNACNTDNEIVEPMCRDSGDEHEFRCICGKNHIQHLAILERDGRRYTMGSTCILELQTIIALEQGDPEVRQKIQEWAHLFAEYHRKREYKECLGCGELKIRIGHEYKDPRRRLRCNKCVKGKRVRCIKCKVFKFHPKNSPKVKFYKICESCYSNTSQHISSEFLSDSE